MLSTDGRRLGWGLFALTYFLIAAAVALAALSAPAFRDPQLIAALAQSVVPPLAIAVAGVVIATTHPGHRLAWVLLAASVVSALSGFLLGYLVHGVISNPGSLPGVEWAAWVANGISAVLYPGLVLLIVLLFPDGRPPSRHWQVLVWLDLGFVLLNILVGALDPTPIQLTALPSIHNPTGLQAFAGLESGPLGWVTFLGSMPLVLAAVVSLILRLRRADGEVRQQVRLVVYVLAVSIVVVIALSLSTLVIPPSPTGRVVGNILNSLVVTLAFGVALPIAMAIAILKYRLYEIDIVISRTLLFAALAAFITLVYVGIVVGLGALIGSRGRANLALSIAATALVAIAFQPARVRFEALANRLVFGYRATPYQALTQFSHRVAASYADEDVLMRLARVLVEGTGAVAASVWVHGLDGAAATWPEGVQDVHPDAASRVATVHQHGEALGELATRRRSGETFTPLESALLEDLAAQAGQVLRNARLRAELEARLTEVSQQAAELRASRQRLVAAQDDERRRLERDIHDGAQQHLAALAIKLRLASTLARRDVTRARHAIEELEAQTADAMTTLSELARGIYPPALRDGGLVPALRVHAVVTAAGIARYEPDVEAAVYFACLEALQNAAKYANATQTTVRLEERDGELRFSVQDDGRGFDSEHARRGSGLQNMQDRIGSFGGTVSVRSRPGEGTVVSGFVRTSHLAGVSA